MDIILNWTLTTKNKNMILMIGERLEEGQINTHIM